MNYSQCSLSAHLAYSTVLLKVLTPEGIQSRPASISYLKSTNYISYFDKRMLNLEIICLVFFFMSFWRWFDMSFFYHLYGHLSYSSGQVFPIN